jgi:hypothetical protein
MMVASYHRQVFLISSEVIQFRLFVGDLGNQIKIHNLHLDLMLLHCFQLNDLDGYFQRLL